MSHSYDAMRCSFLDEQAKEYMDKIKVFVEEAKKVVTSKDVSRQASDEAMHQTITFLSQPLPAILSKEAPFTKNEVDTASLEQLKLEMSKVQRDLFLLKTEQENQKQSAQTVQKEKLKNANQRRKHEKLASKVKDMKEAHLLSLHAVEKKLTKVHNFIKRNSERAQGAAAVNVQKQFQAGAKVNIQNQAQASAEGNVQNQAQAGAEGNVQNQAQANTKVKTIKQVQGTTVYDSHEALTRVVVPKVSVQLRNVDLRLMKTFMLKAPGDKTSWITDMVMTKDGYLIVAEETEKGPSHLKLFDAQVKLLREHSWGWKGRIRLTSLTDDKVLVANGCAIALFRWKALIFHKKIVGTLRSIYQDDEFDISALTSLSSTTFAVGMDRKICLMHENGTIYKVLEIENNEGIFDMCTTTDGALVFCDGYDVLKIDIYTGKLEFERVPGIEYPPSVAEFSNGYVFVCDDRHNVLHLIEPSGKKNLKMWSLNSIIRSEDYLQHVFVYNKNCICLTNFGFMMVFEITG